MARRRGKDTYRETTQGFPLAMTRRTVRWTPISIGRVAMVGWFLWAQAGVQAQNSTLAMTRRNKDDHFFQNIKNMTDLADSDQQDATTTCLVGQETASVGQKTTVPVQAVVEGTELGVPENEGRKWMIRAFFPLAHKATRRSTRSRKWLSTKSDQQSSSSVSTCWSSFPSLDEQWKKRLQEKRDQLMDRAALVSSWLLWKHNEVESCSQNTVGEDEEGVDPDAVTKQSNLKGSLPRNIHIVTTAALPWYTGTAINPLLRAAYLYRSLVEHHGAQQQVQTQTAGGPVQHDVAHAINVTLVVPWLERSEDQEHLYHCQFASPKDQEEFIRSWLGQEAGLWDAAEGLRILFYPARYHEGLRSIFAMGDLIQDVILNHVESPMDLDVCILEEPEHCNWFRAPGDSWTRQFQYVVGIIHTNYKEYAATSHYSGLWTAPALAMICSAMVRAYCHKVIKLSDALQTFCPGKEVTCNVHGVREEFWRQGLDRAEQLQPEHGDELRIEPRVYFLGKLLWAKGLDLLLELEEYYKQCTGSYFEIDVYGSGPDSQDIEKAYAKSRGTTGESSSVLTRPQGTTTATPSASSIVMNSIPSSAMAFAQSSTLFLSSLGNSLQVLAKQHWANLKTSLLTHVEMMPVRLALPPMLKRQQRQEPIPAAFLGRVDHARLPHNYTVFVNPSVSEVLCTATAEALAMGHFVIVPYHPSNYWFFQFPNCLKYRNKLEFVANLRWALTHNPEPLTEDQARQFSWQAATERLFQSASMTHREAAEALRTSSKLESERIAWFHNEVLGRGTFGDLVRKVLGGGPVSEQVRYQQQLAQRHETVGTTDMVEEQNDPDGGAMGSLQESGDDDESDGLGLGFSQSWFATAFRRAWDDAARMGSTPQSKRSSV